ncbi:glycosyltransferase [Povalibacter sp.]|uniref:glycosyltransferase n=1 Tax=Povalibacter sp. TaxID=1962978 RepID=UPI002F40B1B4
MPIPTVSVVIATYNSGNYLKEAIDSVLGQTISDLELLVVDDGSTDGTRDLVARVSDPRLTYIWQPNAGQTSAKNHGVSRARGEFIGFCDGDDYWYPNKLELQLPKFEQSSLTGVVYSPADTIDEHGNSLGGEIAEKFSGPVTHELFLRNFVPFGTAVVRRRCLEEVGGFDESLAMGIDWDLWLRISARYHFDYVPQSTYAYRIWSGQMSRNWRGRYSNAFRIMDNFLRRHPDTVSSRIRRRAYANTYSNRARARMHEHPMAAVQDAARGITLDPWASYSWKTAGRTLINSLRTRGKVTEFERRGESRYLLKRALSPAVRLLTRSEPRILMYHRFGRKAAERTMSADEFRSQMLILKARCDVLTLSELFDSRRTGSRRPLAVVTVDDGYEDFFRIAYPVLRELDLRATVFVTTGFIDGRLHLWPDRIRALLDRSPSGTFDLGGVWEGQRVNLTNKIEREAMWHRLADQLIYATESARSTALEDLSRSLGVALTDNDMRPYGAMTWEQLRELSNAGFEIGDHSQSHASLSLIPPDELRTELLKSKRLLESKLGMPIRSFAYPHGTRRDASADVVAAVHQVGYEQAVLSQPPGTPRATRFELGRFSAACSPQAFRSLIDGFGILRP